MAEYKLFEGDVAPFTDDEFYREREAAHHMEQYGHRDRLIAVLDYAEWARDNLGVETFSDMGCGDGGLIQEANQRNLGPIWGYDMQPSNVEYAQNVRKVDVRWTNFETDASIKYGDCTIMSEVLEHISDPHGAVRNCPSKVLIASSPFHETDEAHYEFHNWAWDDEGYYNLLEQGGYTVLKQEHAWLSQVILGVRE